MQTTKKVIAFVLVALFAAAPFAEAMDAKKAHYVGGTIEILYAVIDSLEYEQGAGRHIAVAVLFSPIALFSKNRLPSAQGPKRNPLRYLRH